MKRFDTKETEILLRHVEAFETQIYPSHGENIDRIFSQYPAFGHYHVCNKDVTKQLDHFICFFKESVQHLNNIVINDGRDPLDVESELGVIRDLFGFGY